MHGDSLVDRAVEFIAWRDVHMCTSRKVPSSGTIVIISVQQTSTAYKIPIVWVHVHLLPSPRTGVQGTGRTYDPGPRYADVTVVFFPSKFFTRNWICSWLHWLKISVLCCLSSCHGYEGKIGITRRLRLKNVGRISTMILFVSIFKLKTSIFKILSA